MIEFRNVTKNYGAFTALDDVSFRIQPGEIVGLVGANGAGKTTTMKLLNRYLTPDAGTVFMDNVDIFAEKNALPMAYIPDAPIYYEFLTVKEHFQFIRDMYPTGEYAVDELIKRFGLQQYLQKMPHALSKGNQQKLMIAMALLRNFSYLIADEPFNGLDPKHMHVLKAILMELRARNKGVLLSTHLLDVIEMFCDRYIMLDGGHVIAIGTKAEILRQHGFDASCTIEDCYIALTDRETGEWDNEDEDLAIDDKEYAAL